MLLHQAALRFEADVFAEVRENGGHWAVEQRQEAVAIGREGGVVGEVLTPCRQADGALARLDFNALRAGRDLCAHVGVIGRGHKKNTACTVGGCDGDETGHSIRGAIIQADAPRLHRGTPRPSG